MRAARPVLTWFVCLAFAYMAILSPAARARAETQPANSSLEDVAEGLAGGALDGIKSHLTSKVLYTALEDQSGRLLRVQRLARAAKLAKGVVDVVELVNGGVKVADHVLNKEYAAAADEALNTAAKFVGGWAGAETGIVLAGIICMSLGPLSAALCIGVLAAAGGALGSAVASYDERQLFPYGERLSCRLRRTAAAACEPTPIDGGPLSADLAEGAGRAGPASGQALPTIASGQGAAAPSAARIQQASPSARGPNSGGRVSAGSTSISVTTENVTAQASGSNVSAVNKIGAIEGGGRAAVSAHNVTTTAGSGVSAETNIGASNGSTVVQGDVVNEGGQLDIGTTAVRRNGQLCVDVYRDTCIVQFYFRRHSDPCAPGYWFHPPNRCDLPSDTRHSLAR